MSRHGCAGVVQAGLVSSVVPYLLRTDDNPDGVPEETLAGMAEGIRDDRAKFMAGFLKDFFGVTASSQPVSQEVLDWAWSQCCRAGLRPTLACADAFAHTDFRPDLAAFAVPTLVIHGTEDATVPIKATGRAAAEGIANAELVEYQGEPHGVFATAKDRLTDDLLRFLKS
jgi:pimeloyl-ACP methyl ester carboxylesterase